MTESVRRRLGAWGAHGFRFVWGWLSPWVTPRAVRAFTDMSAKDIDDVAEAVRKFFKRFPWAVGPPGGAEPLAKALWESGRYSEAVSWAEKWVQMRREHGDRPGEARALWWLGYAHGHAGNLDEALQQLEAALTLTQAANDARNEAFLKRDIGRVHEHRGEPVAAREWLESSLSLFHELGDEPEQKTTREEIGRVAAENDDSPSQPRTSA